MLTLSGTLGRLYLGDLLEWLHLTHATGRLLLSAGDVTRAFDMNRGKVAFVSSSRASERLGSWLLRKGVASREVLMKALVVSQTQGELFTSVLKRNAGIEPAKLAEAGRSLATTLASRVLREDQVIFTFDPTWPVADRNEVDLDLDCRNLIMQAAYRVDTKPVGAQARIAPHTTLDPNTLEALFWHITMELEGELLEATAVTEAHRAFLAVGDLLHRWVAQGPPLLPIGPADAQRILRRLKAGKQPRLEDSPTLVWNLLCLVNGLDAPGQPRASSATEAWEMAGEHAKAFVHFILDNPRWHREKKSANDPALRRAALARIAAARKLAGIVGLEEDTAATAAALPMVVLELVATALSSSPLASSAMQRCALQHLLPLVGQAASTAAGMPELLLAALTSSPSKHPAARLTGLVGLVAGEFPSTAESQEDLTSSADPALASALTAARKAAEKASRTSAEQR
ncbi:MAG TPA: DUF4388 domain-containing protein [Thermoanaerobaculaceae bacterium]|nr:DUF4388 domain-containing protein [Thermoanaerobaculaceae bacterium]